MLQPGRYVHSCWTIFAMLLVLLAVICASAGCVSRTQVVGEETRALYLIEDMDRFQNLERPVVAVSLSGGGARGIANLGVLKALEEEHIPIDILVGTSMGALIGVLYGSGMPVDQIEQVIAVIDPTDLFYINFPFNRSLLNGTELNQFLETLVPFKRLEDFPIPTAVLSFDLNHGVKYVQTTGRVAQAVQGPYAIPGLFPGRLHGQYYLVDAGIHESAPAFAAKKLGADIVIATTTLERRETVRYDGPLSSLGRLISLIQQDYSRPIVSKYSDVIIDFNLKNYSFMDFHLGQRLIDLGYQQAKRQIPAIKKVLQEKGAALRRPGPKYRVNLKQIIQDVRYKRLILPDLVIKPVFYYGKRHTIFGSKQFLPDTRVPQYGAQMLKGPWSVWATTTGAGLDNLEFEVRYKKLTPGLDLKTQAAVDPSSNDWSVSVVHYTDKIAREVGFARLKGSSYAITVSRYDLAIGPICWQGENRLLIPLPSPASDNLIEACTTGNGSISIGETLTVNPRLVYAQAKVLTVPDIYRGAPHNPQDSTLQVGVDVTKRRKLPYSLELLGTVQLSSFNPYMFADWLNCPEGQRALALGLGTRLNLNLFGLNRTGVDGYGSYDLTHRSTQFQLSVDFEF